MADVSVRALILQLMRQLKNEMGLTYLFITHDLATAKYLCDRIAIMYLGRIVELATRDALFAGRTIPTPRRSSRRSRFPTRRRGGTRTFPRARSPAPSIPPRAATSTPAAPSPCPMPRGAPALREIARGTSPPASSTKSRRTTGHRQTPRLPFAPPRLILCGRRSRHERKTRLGKDGYRDNAHRAGLLAVFPGRGHDGKLLGHIGSETIRGGGGHGAEGRHQLVRHRGGIRDGAAEKNLSAALTKLGVKPGSVVVATSGCPFPHRPSIAATIDTRIAALRPYPIDLYQVHQPASFSPIPAQMTEMAKLLGAGKIRSVGVSNFSARQMEEAHAALAAEGIVLASNQVRFSLLDRSIERTACWRRRRSSGSRSSPGRRWRRACSPGGSTRTRPGEAPPPRASP